jgi:hypothetical protein
MTETATAATGSDHTATGQPGRALPQTELALRAAREYPRNIERAAEEMRAACSRISTAERAFYLREDRSTGTTVHLMRELARIWGNVDYGVVEVSRDTAAGRSDIRAYAWDLESNALTSRGFLAPHLKPVTSGLTEKSSEPADIYASNQNIGARAVRECIGHVLPGWWVDEARDLCWTTLDNGDGSPLAERRDRMVDRFAAIGVKPEQLEKRLGDRQRRKWAPIDLAQLSILYTAITREGRDKHEEFPPMTSVTASDIQSRRGRGRGDTQPSRSPRS